jgi:hypothetical protein
MKKLILAVTVAAFTIGAYANDSANNDKPACTGKSACADKQKSAASCCTAGKSQCPAGAKTKQDTAKKVVHSPKGEQNSKS